MIPLEIERKFLVHPGACPLPPSGITMRQGYLSSNAINTVRIRHQGEEARITVKGRPLGISREEFEYAIPLDQADWMLEHLCVSPCVEKTRYLVRVEQSVFEVDVFRGANTGLVMAEVELDQEDAPYARPSWLGPEVTSDKRFTNFSLSKNPWPDWGPMDFPEFTV